MGQPSVLRLGFDREQDAVLVQWPTEDDETRLHEHVRGNILRARRVLRMPHAGGALRIPPSPIVTLSPCRPLGSSPALAASGRSMAESSQPFPPPSATPSGTRHWQSNAALAVSALHRIARRFSGYM